MRHRPCEQVGPRHLGTRVVLLTFGLLLSFISESQGQDYWSSVFPAKPQWGQLAPATDPYRPNGNTGYLSTELVRGAYNPDRSTIERNAASLRLQLDALRASTGPQTVPGFFSGSSQGLQTDNQSNIEFNQLGSWHQLLDLQLQFTRTDRLLLNVLAREADREQISDDRMALLLQEWDMEEAQSRRDWERQCPEQAVWVRDHVRWYGPDSIEALATKLQSVTDCPPGM